MHQEVKLDLIPYVHPISNRIVKMTAQGARSSAFTSKQEHRKTLSSSLLLHPTPGSLSSQT